MSGNYDEYLEQQKAIRAAKAKKTRDTVIAIAAELTKLGLGDCKPEFRAEDGDNGQINLAAGRAIWFSRVWNDNRLEVSGCWPKNEKGEVHSPSNYDKGEYSRITVSLDRPASAVAKDIQRRFLPGYLAAYQAQADRVASSNQYALDTRESIALAARALGQPNPPQDHRSRSSSGNPSISVNTGGRYGHVEASGKSLSLTLHSLTREQAEKILKLVASL